jgi:hypothetical protein
MKAKRRLRLRVTLVSSIALAASVVLLAGNVIPVDETGASWNDSSFAQSTFTADTLKPASGLTCAADNRLLPANSTATFSWVLPDGGAVRTGFRWTLTNTETGGVTSGTTLPSVTSHTVSGPSVPLGSSVSFSLVALGRGTWESIPVSDAISKEPVINLFLIVVGSRLVCAT